MSCSSYFSNSTNADNIELDLFSFSIKILIKWMLFITFILAIPSGFSCWRKQFVQEWNEIPLKAIVRCEIKPARTPKVGRYLHSCRGWNGKNKSSTSCGHRNRHVPTQCSIHMMWGARTREHHSVGCSRSKENYIDMKTGKINHPCFKETVTSTTTPQFSIHIVWHVRTQERIISLQRRVK